MDKQNLYYVLFLHSFGCIFSIKAEGYIFHINSVVPGTKILCTQRISVVKELLDIAEAVHPEEVIGIYRLNSTAAHICYWKEVENNLVAFTSLSGGTIYTKGILHVF